eukprot:2223226-Rhodomonas_salina.1
MPPIHPTHACPRPPAGSACTPARAGSRAHCSRSSSCITAEGSAPPCFFPRSLALSLSRSLALALSGDWSRGPRAGEEERRSFAREREKREGEGGGKGEGGALLLRIGGGEGERKEILRFRFRSVTAAGKIRGAGRAVSYTHLTLPTICSV